MSLGIRGSALTIVFVAIIGFPPVSSPSAKEVPVERCDSNHYFNVDRNNCHPYTRCSLKFRRIARKGNATADNECGGCLETYYLSWDGHCYCCYKHGDAGYLAVNNSNCPSVNVTLDQLECLRKPGTSAPGGIDENIPRVHVIQMKQPPTVLPTTASVDPVSPTTRRPITSPDHEKTVSPVKTPLPPTDEAYPEWVKVVVICLIILVVMALIILIIVKWKDGKKLHGKFHGVELRIEVIKMPGGQLCGYVEKCQKQEQELKQITPDETKSEQASAEPLLGSFRGEDDNFSTSPVVVDDRQTNEVVHCHYLSEKQRAVCKEVLKKNSVAILYVWSERCLYTYEPNEERCEPWSDYFDGARAHYQFCQNLYKFQSGSSDSISLLPFALLKELAQTLDVPRQSSKDYRLLASHFDYSCAGVNHLGKEHMKRHGSPFLRLVWELAGKGIAVEGLIGALRTIDHPALAEKVVEHADAVARYWKSVEEKWNDYCKRQLEKRPFLKSDKRDLVVHSKTSFDCLQRIAKEMDNQEKIDVDDSWMKWISFFHLASIDAENMRKERNAFWSTMEETPETSPTFSFVQKVLDCVPDLTFRHLSESLPKKVARCMRDNTMEQNAMS